MQSFILTAGLVALALFSTAQDKTFGPVRWTFATEGRFFNNPAITGNTLLAGNSDHKLYALDAGTGQLRWAFETGGGIATEPCVAGNVAVIGSYDGHYYAVDVRTGRERWRFKTGGERKLGGKGLWTMQPLTQYMEDPYDFFLSSPVAGSRHVYFGSSDSCIYAVNIATGKQAWQFRTRGPVHGSVAYSENTVIAGSWDTYLYALDAQTGNAAALLDSAQAINFGHLAAGAPFEQYSTTISVMDKLYRLGPFTSTPIFHQNLVIAASTNGLVYGISVE